MGGKAEGDGDSDASSKGKLDESQAVLLGQSYIPHESQLQLWGLVRVISLVDGPAEERIPILSQHLEKGLYC